MSITPDQITIAVTVYSRREYLAQSVGSALGQSVPVRVMVIEDCGPDPGMESYVRQTFGPRVEYHRNPNRRGIFGNWNSCIERCPTRWLSILHDDDYLQPGFVASILELGRQAGDKGLYWGQTVVIDGHGAQKPEWIKPPLPGPWRPVGLEEVLRQAPFSFPGQLFDVELAKSVGLFRETSLFSGDLELWVKLIAARGGAETADTVAVFRDHDGWDRGSNRIYRSGKTYALMNVQRKRSLALYRRLGGYGRFDRRDELRRSCLPIRYLLYYAAEFSPRLLAYYRGLLVLSTPCHWRYAAFQYLACLLGPGFLRRTSAAWRRVKHFPPRTAHRPDA